MLETVITPKDVARAEKEVRACRKVWDRYGRREVSDRELNEAGDQVSRSGHELRSLRSLGWRWMQLKCGLLWLLDGSGVAKWGWPIAALIAGTAAVAVAVLPLVLLSGRMFPVLLGLVLCFLIAASATVVVLLPLSGKGTGEELRGLKARLRIQRDRIDVVQARFNALNHHLSGLRRVRSTQEAYERAIERHDWLIATLKDRRYQLVHSDWRALRDTAFEDFVAEIFELLGFSVKKTKVTGDQGVDLVAEGKGRRIAVQTKGYKGGVGNDAVQEVHAGMKFYQCLECLVVTNSYFTPSAIALARSCECKLIDGRSIARLIEGNLY
jgi:hypothetical protein